MTGLDFMPLYKTADIMNIEIAEEHLVCFKYIEMKAVEYMSKD